MGPGGWQLSLTGFSAGNILGWDPSAVPRSLHGPPGFTASKMELGLMPCSQEGGGMSRNGAGMSQKGAGAS